MASWTVNIFVLLLNLQGVAVGLLLLAIIAGPAWRVLVLEKSIKYVEGFARVGIWSICLPPTLEGPDGYSIHCCHNFGIFEEFFPVEMKIAQVLTPVAFCLTVIGLYIFFVAQEWRLRTPKPARWLFLTAGIFYLISSICILVPISWNVYSVAQNKLIPFPAPFRLPTPLQQKNGAAIVEGYISALCLLISGTYIIAKCFIKPD